MDIGAGGISVTVDKLVDVVAGFDPIELCQVRDVMPLESDSLGKLDVWDLGC